MPRHILPIHPTTRTRFGLALGWFVVWTLTGLVTSASAQVPGPESFAAPPKTPMEFWDAADYLVRTGQAKLAVPYLNSLMKAEPDDATLIRIRDEYGIGAILRLSDHPETRSVAQPLIEKINAAVKKRATDPDRIANAIELLTKSREEQSHGVARLREAGPYAIPALIKKLEENGQSAESRGLVVINMGRLDASTMPAIVAALSAPNRTIGADAATVLGLMGDPRAVPFLTYPAAASDSPGLRTAAREAIARITGRPFELQPQSPLRVLADEAWKYHRHQIKFPSEQVEVWLWNSEAESPAPQVVPRTVAESILGGRLANEALLLDKADISAQTVFVSFLLEKPSERFGFAEVSRETNPAFSQAMATGPQILTNVLKTAIKDGHYDLAATTAIALGRVGDRDAAVVPEQVGPLVQALSAPSRRVQYAAATALVEMNPSKPFVGSSRVVPILSRFLSNRAPKALIVDGNVNRGNSVATSIKQIGYEIAVTQSGPEAFREAASGSDIEIILIEPTVLQGAWSANDFLTNLRADSRTAGIPVFLYGPLALRDRLGVLLKNFDKVDFLVTPTDSTLARDLMGRRLDAMGTRSMTPAERAGFAQGAASQLAMVASRSNSPFAADLTRAEPELARGLDNPAAAENSAIALGDIPGGDSQRSLARVAFDPSKPAPLRFAAARGLARNIQRFGPLLSTDHEKRLVAVMDDEADPAIKGALAAVYGALRPSPEVTGARLQGYKPPKAAPSTPTPPAAPAKPPEAGAEKTPEEPAEKP